MSIFSEDGPLVICSKLAFGIFGSFKRRGRNGGVETILKCNSTFFCFVGSLPLEELVQICIAFLWRLHLEVVSKRYGNICTSYYQQIICMTVHQHYSCLYMQRWYVSTISLLLICSLVKGSKDFPILLKIICIRFGLRLISAILFKQINEFVLDSSSYSKNDICGLCFCL